MIDINARLRAMSVDSSRGAPMGRQDYVNDDAAEVAVQRVLFQDGDYDLGGAYWGGPDPLFCAMDEADQVCVFIRADDHKAAVAELLLQHPDFTVQAGIDIVEATNGFLEAMLFAESDRDGDPDDDSSLRDQNYGIEDFSTAAQEKARSDVEDFVTHINTLGLSTLAWSSNQIGANFYFDRCGHGCGAKDVNHPSADQLQRLASTWGSVMCWINQPAEGQAYGTIDWE